MTYRYIYKITCTAGSFKDKFYFGKHTTNNLNDNYKGSGCKLVAYYKKYPDDYIKEIISYHNSQEELDNAEYDIIHPWLGNPMCLNLRDGGNQGIILKESRSKMSNSSKGKYVSEETRKKISESQKGRIPWNKGKHNIYSEETRKKISNTLIEKNKSGEIICYWTGKHLTDDMKSKISETLKGHTTWNKGIPFSEESREKMSKSHKGKHKVYDDKINNIFHYE